MDDLLEFLDNKKIEFYRSREIKTYLTLRIGGKVGFVIIIRSSRDLEALLVILQKKKRNFIILGGGSNVLFPDHSSDLIVIINRTSEIGEPAGGLLGINSGVANINLLNRCIEYQTGGLEFLAGIPGTIGGAAAVNAGAFGKAMAEILEKADIFTKNGEIKTVNRDYFRYGYRDSIFKYGSEVILDVYLKYETASGEEIKNKIRHHIQYRKNNHPSYNVHTAGCFFKNPVHNGQKISAGKLIEASGLKGAEHKDLLISPAHANFLINRGGAVFSDIDEFSRHIREQVFKSSGILLEREVIYISPDGKKY